MENSAEINRTAFDSSAFDYDDTFTNTWTGLRQRRSVWRFLDRNISPDKFYSVLEINCGTGEDAKRFSERGFSIVGTDISPEMISIANTKKIKQKIINTEFVIADIKSIASEFSGRKFNLIFSNFGGLNCLSPDELRATCIQFNELLETNGRLIFVVMGRKCMWEYLYFMFRNNKSEAVRRKNIKAVNVKIKEEELDIWYYSPSELSGFFNERFTCTKTKPIGLFIPPSYLNEGIKENKILKTILGVSEFIFGRFSSFSDYADHYLIELKRR